VQVDTLDAHGRRKEAKDVRERYGLLSDVENRKTLERVAFGPDKSN
jgi:hypothetical protein